MSEEYYREAVFYNSDGEHPVKRYYTWEYLYDATDDELNYKYRQPFYDFLDKMNIKLAQGTFLGKDFLKLVGVNIKNKEAVPYTLFYPAECDINETEKMVFDKALELKQKLKPIIATIDLGVLIEKEIKGELNLGGKKSPLFYLTEDVIKPDNISNTASFMLEWLGILNSQGQTVVITDNYLFPKRFDEQYKQDLNEILKFLKANKIEHYGMDKTFNEEFFVSVKENLESFGTEIEHHNIEDFHDRFWINKNTKEGLVFGTSLNGIGKKLCYIDVIKEDDAKIVIDYIG